MSFKSAIQKYPWKNLQKQKIKTYCKKFVACHKNLIPDFNSAYQNYVRIRVKIIAINFLLACVIKTTVFFSACLKTIFKVFLFIHFKVNNIK